MRIAAGLAVGISSAQDYNHRSRRSIGLGAAGDAIVKLVMTVIIILSTAYAPICFYTTLVCSRPVAPTPVSAVPYLIFVLPLVIDTPIHYESSNTLAR